MDYQDNNQEQDTVKEKVAHTLSEIRRSEKKRDERRDTHRWKELINEFKGRFDIADGSSDITILPLNLIFAYVKTELASLYIRDPRLSINPKNQTSIKTSAVLEEVINYLWYYKKLKREIKKCIIDTLLIGHSWFKTGYTGKFGTVEDNNGGTIETIESEDFFGYRIPWENIITDCESIDPPYDCKWIAHATWVPIEEVKKNPRYKNTDKLNVNLSSKDEGSNNDYEKQQKEGKVCLYEVWKMTDKTICVVSPGVDDYIEDPKPFPYEMRGYPFSYLRFNSANDDQFGISDVATFEPQLLELIKLRSASIDHIKRFNRQLITTPDNISPDEEEKLVQNITGSIVKVMDPSKIGPLPYAPLATDYYAIEDRLKEDMINISGQSAAERGAMQKTSTRTIRELMQMQQGSGNRRAEKLDQVEEFVEDIATNLISLIKQFATFPYYVRILGNNSPELQAAIMERPSAGSPEGVTSNKGFTFTKEDIEGEYDVEAVSGSSVPLDNQEQLKVLFQTIELAPKAGAIPGGPFIGAVVKMIIDKFYMPELKAALAAEQQLQQQMKAEQQQQGKEMQQMQLMNLASQRQLDATKVATQQSKAVSKSVNDEKRLVLDEQRMILEHEAAMQEDESAE